MKTRFKKRFLYISTSNVSLRPSFMHVLYAHICVHIIIAYKKMKLKQIIFASANKPDRHYLVGFNSSPFVFHFAFALIISMQDRWSCTCDCFIYLYSEPIHSRNLYLACIYDAFTILTELYVYF